MPALNPLTEDAYELQMNFVKSGGVGIALNMLAKNNFMSSADLFTRRYRNSRWKYSDGFVIREGSSKTH